MKAISIQQPWAWAILAKDKDIENRTWPTRHRGPVFIHASKTYDRYAHKQIEDILGIAIPEDLPRGGIVGLAEIVDCVTESDSKWFSGPVGFVLANPDPLPFIRLKGRLGLFDVDIASLKDLKT